MYSVTVPMMSRTFARAGQAERQTLLQQLQQAGAQRVLLALEPYRLDAAWQEETFRLLREQTAFFRTAGLEVGVWLWTFMCDDTNPYTKMVGIDGRVSAQEVCPADPAFIAFAAQYVERIAACGPDLILYDDDYRYGHLDMGLGCCCPHHMAALSARVGYTVTREALRGQLFCGEPGALRAAWFATRGEILRDFARAMRAAVDRVDPAIRLGQCACISSFGADGILPVELSRTLAGGTRPFLRLIGAPYWAVRENWGNRLADVIVEERMEAALCRQGDVELLAEGDTYPRPRYTTPAAYLEGFDTAMRADGGVDGILKYMVDYTASPAYETGYFQWHLRNRELYAGIAELFADKQAVGLRLYPDIRRYEAAVLPAGCDGVQAVENALFLPEIRAANAASLPVAFAGGGMPGMVFGECARRLPAAALLDGLILDIAAAQILTQRGVDVGLAGVQGSCRIREEYFLPQGDYLGLEDAAEVFRLQLCAGAQPLSTAAAAGETLCTAYHYENAAGQRFCVLAYDAARWPEAAYRNYLRAAQLTAAAAYVGRRPLPAVCPGAPDLYILVKQGADGRLAVGLWNFSADEVFAPCITLDRPRRLRRMLATAGRAEKNRVHLQTLPPYGFAAFEAE